MLALGLAVGCGSPTAPGDPSDPQDEPEARGGATGSSRRDGAAPAAGGDRGNVDGPSRVVDASAARDGASGPDAPGIEAGSPTVELRRRASLNKNPWKFKKGNVAGAENPTHDDAGWLGVTIPHDWNGGVDGVHNDVFKGRDMYRGPAWYRMRFRVDAADRGKQLFIEFEAVSLVADVWLNGKHLGQHRGGFTAFSFDITEHVRFDGDNVLAVKADSSNDPTVAPWMEIPYSRWPTAYDYAVYGGIYRDVWLTVTDKARIEAVFCDTPQVSAASSLVRVRTEVKNHADAPRAVTVTSEVVDASGAVVTTFKATQTIPAGQGHTFDQTSAAIQTPHLWSPADPYLYQVRSTLSIDGRDVDGVTSPLGFRWFTLPKQGTFTLNGNPLPLRGVNRHQDRQGVGYALSNEDHRRDVQLTKETGFNFLRHAHYPADPAVLQATDELGLLVWLEIPVTMSISTNPAFLANAKSQLREMIRQSYNHPSVITWGLGNEADNAVAIAGRPLTEAYANRFFRELHDVAREVDRTRPTIGCNFVRPSNQNIPDVYSPQHWRGWYGGATWVGTYEPTQLIGEFGADIALERHYEPGSERKNDWSQEYGARLHEYYVAVGEERKSLFPGYATFVLADFASPRSDRSGPPCGPGQACTYSSNTIKWMNQKGLFLHDHKTPKDIWYFYKSVLLDKKTKPMVYIVSHTWLDRWTAPAAKDVWVYSNTDEVRLYNGVGTHPFGARSQKVGEHPTVKTRFQWDKINVRYNVLYAEGLVDGKVVATDKIELKNLPPPP